MLSRLSFLMEGGLTSFDTGQERELRQILTEQRIKDIGRCTHKTAPDIARAQAGSMHSCWYT